MTFSFQFDKDELIESPKHQPPSTPILKDFPPKELQYSNISNVHEVKLLREKLDQATQATNAALAQVNLLRDQLQAESTARIEAQVLYFIIMIHFMAAACLTPNSCYLCLCNGLLRCNL